MRGLSLSKTRLAQAAAKRPQWRAQFGSLSPSVSVEDFQKVLKDSGRTRAFFVWDAERGELLTSDESLAPLAEAMQANSGPLARDFDHHEGVFVEVGPRSGALCGAFLHKTIRGQGQGGTRLWRYDSISDYFCDGLRLSRGMGRKSALAGIFWGGGKGVIARPTGTADLTPAQREAIFKDYGAFVSSINGCYVTAEDVGVTVADLTNTHSTTRYVTCVPPAIGGSGNPSEKTAQGVVSSMEGAIAFRSGATEAAGLLEGKVVAVMGAGNVARFMLAELLAKGVKRVVMSDISSDSLAAAAKVANGDPRVEFRHVAPGDVSVLFEDADIVSPCALGGVLNAETIPNVRAGIICGAANNPLLEEESDDAALAERGILYVPDFISNRMGIVNCANEAYGKMRLDPEILRHFDPAWKNSCYNITQQVLREASAKSQPTGITATLIADQMMQEPHPIFPHRSALIIKDLMESEWHLQEPVVSQP